MNFFADNLRFLRKSKGFTQTELAENLSFKRTALSSYELKAAEPDIDTILRIADYFGVTVGEILSKKMTEDVHLNEINDNKQENKNVHQDVHPTVHLIHKVSKINTNEDLKTFPSFNLANVYDIGVNSTARLKELLENEDVLRESFSFSLPHLGMGLHIRVKVNGNEMEPTLKNEDFAIATQITKPFTSVVSGAIYIVLTNDDKLHFTRLYLSGPNECDLVTDNGKYPPLKQSLNDIQALFIVREVHRAKLGNIDAEIRYKATREWKMQDQIKQIVPL